MREDGEKIFGVSLLIGIIIGSSAAYYFAKNSIHNDAIKAGVATYEVNKETGEVTFKWVKNEN